MINVIGGTPPKCGQVTISAKYVPNAVAFAKAKGWVGSAGTCVSKGYTTETNKLTLPVTVTGYTGRPLVATVYHEKRSTTMITVIGSGSGSKGTLCGQVTMATAYVGRAVAWAKAKGWKATAGTCASQGYGLKGAWQVGESCPPLGSDACVAPMSCCELLKVPVLLTGFTGHALVATLFQKNAPGCKVRSAHPHSKGAHC